MLILVIGGLLCYLSFGPEFDDSGRAWFGLNSWGLAGNLEQFRNHLERGKPAPPVNTSSIPSIWEDEGNVFYTLSYHGFDAEVICRVGDRENMPVSTTYGVIRWSKHLDGDYWWMVLRS